MATNLEIRGLDKLFKKLDGIEPKLRKTVLKKALTNGANITLAQAKALCPLGHGTMRDKLMVKNIPRLGRKAVGVMVTFRASKKLHYTTKAGHTYFIPAAVEFGHAAPHVTEALIVKAGGKRSHKDGFAPKSTPPHPFLRPAYDSTKGQAKASIAADVNQFIATQNKS